MRNEKGAMEREGWKGRDGKGWMKREGWRIEGGVKEGGRE